MGPADAPPGAGTSVLAKHGQASSKAEAERALNRAGACRAAKVSCDKSVAAAKASLIARCSECSTNSDGSLSLLQQLNAVGDICKSSSYSEQADVTMAQQNYVASEEYGRAADSSGSNPDTGGKTPGGAPGTGSKSPGGAPGTGSKAPSDSTAKTPSSKSGDGGIGQIAQAAMPLLTAMMNQQNQPTPPPVAPPTIPSVQCGGAMVSGQCPPTAVAASDAWKMPAGTYGLQPSSASKGSFNTADNKNPNTSPDVPTVEPSKTASSANVVPNGGGQMPGQGGSGGGATLGGNGAAGAGAQGIMGKVADVLHGLSGGSSLSAQAQAMNTSTGGSGGWSGYEKGGSGAEAPVDWSQWLPGGKNAARQLAGGNARIVQIQSKEVNIWSRISDHIRARCNQGLLRDCIP